jgi:hypothetical protein
MSVLFLMVLAFLARAAATHDLPQHEYAAAVPALVIMVGFFLLYVGHTPYVGLFRPRRLDGVEATLAVVVGIVTYVGAAGVLLTYPHGRLGCGAAGAAVSLAFYGVAALSYSRHGEESGSFYPLSGIAFLYALCSFSLLLGWEPVLAAAFQGLGFLLAIFAARYGTRSIIGQALALTGLGFVVVVLTGVRLSAPDAEEVERALSAAWVLSTGVLALATYVRLRSAKLFGPAREGRPDLPAIGLAVVFSCGVLAAFLGASVFVFDLAAGGFGVGAGSAASTALWHTVRTVSAMVGAVAVLALGLRFRIPGATPLAVALMGLGGAKLFLFDAFRIPGPWLIVSSAIFGVALLLSSRLYRHSRGLTEGGPVAGSAQPGAPP